MLSVISVGSLFSGIGGLDLGLERCGMAVKWQVEIDETCLSILEAHWPKVTKYGDIRTFDPTTAEPVDLVCGGFPCQDVSVAAPRKKRRGIDGPRSGLWAEMFRVVREIRPRFVLVENVPGLLIWGMDRVLGDLASIGFDAEWDCVPAAAFGLPHRRDRVFVVAYPHGLLCQTTNIFAGVLDYVSGLAAAELAASQSAARVCGMDDGIPGEMVCVEKLGNAVVPQVAEWIGRRIIRAAGCYA